MDSQRFDAFAKMAATGMTRRRALRGVGGFAAAAAGFLALGKSGEARGGTGPITVRQPCDNTCLGRCRARCKTPQCRRECNDVCERRCDND